MLRDAQTPKLRSCELNVKVSITWYSRNQIGGDTESPGYGASPPFGGMGLPRGKPVGKTE